MIQTDAHVQASVLSALLDGPQFICIHDTHRPQETYVSPSFLEFSGLPADAVRSPDLLQRLVHPDDVRSVTDAWARAAQGERVPYEFRMRCPDGSYRWMSALARALPDETGDGHRFVVTAQDVDDRKRSDERLRVLVRAGEIFHRSLNLDETLTNVARLAVIGFADLCIFDLLEASEQRLYVTVAAHRDPRRESELRDVGELLHDRRYGTHPMAVVAETGESYFLPRIDDGVIAAHASSPQHAEFMKRMGYTSKIVVPVLGAGAIFGALTFVRTGDTRYFDEADLDFAKELGRRAGTAVMNARQYMRQQHLASTLQRAFLPEEFPVRPGVRFDGLYRPGKRDAQLGGDWYDAFETRRGHIVIAIGDVTGNGVEAAQTMVQLREAIRVASVRSVDPPEILALANDALFVERSDKFASAWVGIIPPSANELTYASAGHPPPFMRDGSGAVRQLPQSGQMLGVAREFDVCKYTVPLEAGSLLALYTDGLTEISRDVLSAERRIAGVLSSPAILHDPRPAESLERAVIDASELCDDVAILIVRFG